jgi:hypothetical protein
MYAGKQAPGMHSVESCNAPASTFFETVDTSHMSSPVCAMGNKALYVAGPKRHHRKPVPSPVRTTEQHE